MNEQDRKLLEDDGWTIECESPFEIRTENGDFASGTAAIYILIYLQEKQLRAYETCQSRSLQTLA